MKRPCPAGCSEPCHRRLRRRRFGRYDSHDGGPDHDGSSGADRPSDVSCRGGVRCTDVGWNVDCGGVGNVAIARVHRYIAWVVSRNGEWQQIAAWGPTSGARAIVSGASSIPTSDIDEVVVTADDPGDTIATAKVPSG